MVFKFLTILMVTIAAVAGQYGYGHPVAQWMSASYSGSPYGRQSQQALSTSQMVSSPSELQVMTIPIGSQSGLSSASQMSYLAAPAQQIAYPASSQLAYPTASQVSYSSAQQLAYPAASQLAYSRFSGPPRRTILLMDESGEQNEEMDPAVATKRHSNTNVQSGIYQMGNGNFNLQGGITQSNRRSQMASQASAQLSDQNQASAAQAQLSDLKQASAAQAQLSDPRQANAAQAMAQYSAAMQSNTAAAQAQLSDLNQASAAQAQAQLQSRYNSNQQSSIQQSGGQNSNVQSDVRQTFG